MSCNLTQGYSIDYCYRGLSGIKAMFIILFDDVHAIAKSGGIITTISLSTGKVFYKYELQRNTSQYRETPDFNRSTGEYRYEQELNIVLNRLNVPIRNEVLILAKKLTTIIIQDTRGVYWMMGERGGSLLQSGEVGPGIIGTDRSGFSLVFRAMEQEYAAEVDPSVFVNNFILTEDLFIILDESGNKLIVEST